MTPEEWSRIETIFHDALERPDVERAVFLDRACGGDSALRRHVESLIRQAGENRTALTALPVEELMVGRSLSLAAGRRIGARVPVLARHLL